MLDKYFVEHCAPTLAGLKTANLFTYPVSCRKTLMEELRHANRRLCGKGLRVLPLRFSDKNALIYIYRPCRLSHDLSHETAAGILHGCGYSGGSSEHCVAQLARRLRTEEDFPHEIGLFLGYPPEDVCGFMENRGADCKCIGCWKVYGDEKAAREKFDRYKCCTRSLCCRWAEGEAVEQLAQAM